VPLKSIGLGEPAVFLVWGPLMIGGGYAMIAGEISPAAFWASVPYGLGVMAILVGKHIDQMDFDRGKSIRTLPVLLGERAARILNVATIALIYAVTAGLIAFGQLTPFAAVIAFAFPRAWRAMRLMSQPRPQKAPEGYVGWPLWYHRACLTHNRVFGWLYISGSRSARSGRARASSAVRSALAGLALLACAQAHAQVVLNASSSASPAHPLPPACWCRSAPMSRRSRSAGSVAPSCPRPPSGRPRRSTACATG